MFVCHPQGSPCLCSFRRNTIHENWRPTSDLFWPWRLISEFVDFLWKRWKLPSSSDRGSPYLSYFFYQLVYAANCYGSCLFHFVLLSSYFLTVVLISFLLLTCIPAFLRVSDVVFFQIREIYTVDSNCLITTGFRSPMYV